MLYYVSSYPIRRKMFSHFTSGHTNSQIVSIFYVYYVENSKFFSLRGKQQK